MPTWDFFDSFLIGQLNGSVTNTPIDFDTDDMRVGLTDSGLAPVAATQDFWNDFNAANEVTGGGYTAGGFVLVSEAVTDEGSSVIKFDAGDATWFENATGFTDARFAILYKFNAAAGSAPLVAWLDFVTDKGNTTGDLVIQMDAANGIFTLSG